mgnify:CR=1 FL=1
MSACLRPPGTGVSFLSGQNMPARIKYACSPQFEAVWEGRLLVLVIYKTINLENSRKMIPSMLNYIEAKRGKIKMEIGKISIIGGLILSALGIIGNVVTTVLNKKLEFENQVYKTIIDCAYKEWETKTHLVKDIAEKTGKGVGFVPFSDYILFYLHLGHLSG